MKLNLNSLKAYHLFSHHTQYQLSPHNNVGLENMNLSDHVTDIDIQYISTIINLKEQLKKYIPLDIFNHITVQINVNDYYEQIDNDQIKHDLSSVNVLAYPIDKLLIFGTKYRANHISILEMTDHLSLKEEVKFVFSHEISHILEYDYIKNRTPLKNDSFSTHFFDFLLEKKLKSFSFYQKTDNHLEDLFITLSSEMYADTMAILLNNTSNIKDNLHFLQKVIEYRVKENLHSLTSRSSSNGLPYSPGITSDHFTLSALQKLEKEIQLSSPNTLEEMNELAQRCVSFGMMKHILFMSKIENLQSPLFQLLSHVLGYAVTNKNIEVLLSAALDKKTIEDMNQALSHEHLTNSTPSSLNKNKFKAVFHPVIFEQENTPMKILSAEERLQLVEFLRQKNVSTSKLTMK